MVIYNEHIVLCRVILHAPLYEFGEVGRVRHVDIPHVLHDR